MGDPHRGQNACALFPPLSAVHSMEDAMTRRALFASMNDLSELLHRQGQIDTYMPHVAAIGSSMAYEISYSRVVARDSPFTILWLVRSKNEIVNSLSSLITTNQLFGIEGLTDRILVESRTCYEGIRLFRCHRIDLKFHVVPVGIVIIERQRQAVPDRPRWQYAIAL